MGGKHGPAEERFWRKVVKLEGPDACWEWIGYIQPIDARGNGGYGRFRISKGNWGWAHNFAYQIQHGPLAKGECSLHTCDNRRCVRGAHLFKGTRTINAADRDAKGRTSRGERHSAAMRAAWARRKALVVP
jgi:Autographiviridae endonuclease